LRETKEALIKKEVALATQRAENLKKVLSEAGAVLYSQTGQAGKGGPYAETRWTGSEPPPDVGASSRDEQPRSKGAKVVDAEYKEDK
jgi:molecular chaperone DnaK